MRVGRKEAAGGGGGEAVAHYGGEDRRTMHESQVGKKRPGRREKSSGRRRAGSLGPRLKEERAAGIGGGLMGGGNSIADAVGGLGKLTGPVAGPAGGVGKAQPLTGGMEGVVGRISRTVSSGASVPNVWNALGSLTKLTGLVKTEGDVLNVKPLVNYTASMLGLFDGTPPGERELDPNNYRDVLRQTFLIWNPKVMGILICDSCMCIDNWTWCCSF